MERKISSKNQKRNSLFMAGLILVFSSCQSLPQTASPVQIAAQATTATAQPATETLTEEPATETPTVTPTLLPVSARSLAGLIISSPILGGLFEVPGVRPTEVITANGLGIINSEGKLIKFAEAGLFESFSPSGTQIVYQHGIEDEYTDRVDNLFVYDSATGATTEILDDLEHEGGKTVLSWSPDEQRFIYYNDYLTVLFEAFGYFGPTQLLLADVRTGHARLLIRDGYQFDISPDQTQIAYTRGEVLDIKTKTYGGQPLERFGCFQPRIYDIGSSASQPFDVGQLSDKPLCVGYPKWSPDGKKIAWMGYFEDNTFRPIIFEVQGKAGRIYDALDQQPRSTNMPTRWYFGEPPFGGSFDPSWVDNSTFWTPSYELNTDTGEMSSPRELSSPYYYRRGKFIQSPNGLLRISADEERDVILISDTNGNSLSSFSVNDLYDGPKQEILTGPFSLPGRTHIVGWSPFAPAPRNGNK